MIVVGTANAARKTRHLAGGRDELPVVYRSEWLSAGQDPELSPTAMLIEQPPFSVSPGHYHKNNEFQVVISGNGTIGRHPVRPFMLHYAGSYTGYGPLVAGPEGLAYLTLRTVYERGVVRGLREMIRGPKRQIHVPALEPSPLDTAPFSDPMVEELIPLGEDRLNAVRVRLPGGAAWPGTDPAGSAGQFHLVLTGDYIFRDEVFGHLDLFFFSNDEAAPVVKAGTRGLDMLVLQIPLLDPAYRASAAGSGRVSK